MHYHYLFFTTYEWLVNQNLWKAAVNWVVAGILATVFVRRPWKNHKKAQAKIVDSLDVGTPGGLETVVSKLDALSERIAAREDKP